jgi:mRNA interferase MazF
MQRREVWFAASDDGNRPVLVLTETQSPIASDSVVVAAIARTVRGLVFELELTATDDGVPTDCVVNFDNVHTIPRDAIGRQSSSSNSRSSLKPATPARRHRMLRRRQPAR